MKLRLASVLFSATLLAGTASAADKRWDGADDLPVNPHVPWLVRTWKSILRPVGVLAAFATILGVFGHYTKYGPKEPPEGDVVGQGRTS